MVWAIDALERQCARIEREFYLSCEAQDRVRELYEPTRPGGLPWTDASVAAVVRKICATLRHIVSDVGWAAREHVERNAPCYGAHRVLIDAIEIELRPGSAWSREEALRALGQERALRRRANDMTLAVGEQMRADRPARRLSASFARHRANAAQVRALGRTGELASSVVVVGDRVGQQPTARVAGGPAGGGRPAGYSMRSHTT